MKHSMKILLTWLMVLTLLPMTRIEAEENIHEITLNSTENADGSYSFKAEIDGKTIEEYDYVWHADPTVVHKDVKNSPAEYYTGEQTEGDIYIAHDIYYYPELDSSKYIKARYGDETEWLYYYDTEEYSDYIFATLPVEGNDVPTRMMHTEEEAYNNAVLHINKAGTYKLSGNWHGQIYVDLKEDSFDDPQAVVTLVLDNANIECSVASGICFYQVYEVDNAWEDKDEAVTSVDTSDAGANIIIADDSTNHVAGTNIYRILKTKYKDEDSSDLIKEQKKSKKVDGALYSYMSLNVDKEEKGNGILYINSEFEGLDSELHLTINGGNIYITADNDGINVNEDGVSVFTMNGGTLEILAGTGYEGDGVDSNGYININGGTLISSAKPQSDSGLDSDMGTYINGGRVIAMGSSMDVVTEYSEDANQVTMNLIFNSEESITSSISVKDENEKVIFAYDLSKNDFYKDSGRTYQCLILSDDSFKVGSNYTLYEGGTLKGEETEGIYTNVKKLTDARSLVYTSTGYSNPFGGFGMKNPNMLNDAGFENTEGFDPSQMEGVPEMSEGFDPSQMGDVPKMPDGFDPSQMEDVPQMPNGEQPQTQVGVPDGQRPEKPDGTGNMTPPQGQGDESFNPQNMGNNESGNSDVKSIFTIEDKVNTYSGVYAASLQSPSNTLPIWAIIAISVCAGAIVATGVILIVKKKKKIEE